jgi:AcrR family transcriptional regulator
MGELVALEQIRADAATLDRQAIAVGPFARLDAGAVAARDGKTRGAITNLFGSQAAIQAETMALALSVGDWIEQIPYPAPADHDTADAWFDAVLGGESERGPRHGAEPTGSYAFLWILWLSTVPYGTWSDTVSAPSMAEHVQWVAKLRCVLEAGLAHFGLATRPDTTVDDLASGLASLVEGVWLNQCLTDRHPTLPSEPIATSLLRAGRLLWRGAVAG